MRACARARARVCVRARDLICVMSYSDLWVLHTVHSDLCADKWDPLILGLSRGEDG